MRKSLVVGGLLCAGFVSGAAAGETLLTTNGYQITSTPADTMSCAEISNQLSAIDDTGYRLGGPVPSNEGDNAVYEYELSLSVAFFWRCATQVDDSAQSDAFRSGFSDQQKN